VLGWSSSFEGIGLTEAQIACEGIVEVDVPVRGTYLRAIDDRPYSGQGRYTYDEDLEMDVIVSTPYRVQEPAIVDLQANGFVEGDRIMISYWATVYYCGVWNPSNPASTDCGVARPPDLWWGVGGLFSATPELLPISELDRVPTAIDAGPDIVTPETYWTDKLEGISAHLMGKGISWYDGPMNTDIPEDFMIAPYTGMSIVIPSGAKYLFLSIIDVYYRDNLGSVKVTIEKDTDGDGIPDAWEQNGIDVDCDGQIDLDLPMLGADWLHKDIFVEIDYMGGLGTVGHNHEPRLGSIWNVQEAFAKAPVSNPDGTQGINLHYIIDEATYGEHKDVINWGDFDSIKSANFGTLDERQNPKTIQAKKLVYHYALFAHNYPGGSGSGEAPGNDFIVALGASATRAEEDGTFMHELGHNLGLYHGGDIRQKKVNYKPNYLSVMNYLFQFDYKVPGRPLDYSWIELPTLNEASLVENNGIQGPPGLRTAYSLPNGTSVVVSADSPIDWNLDGEFTTVAANINNVTTPSPAGEELWGYNDWDNLVYRFRNTPGFADGEHPVVDEEITVEMIEEMRIFSEKAKEHDLAVTNLEYSGDAVAKGETFEITVDLENLGINVETFKVAVYANSAIVGSRTVTLTNGSDTTETITCETKDLDLGDYALMVYAIPVTGERFLYDNIAMGNPFKILEPSSVSTSLTALTITYNENLTVTNEITPALSEGTITAEYSLDKVDWAQIGSGAPLEGLYSIVWTPQSAGTFYIRASWNGTENYLGSTSIEQTLTVNKAPTSLQLSISPETAQIDPQTQEEAIAEVSGSITPALAGIDVTITYTRPDGTTTKATTTTTSGGDFTDTLSMDEVGNWTISASWTGNTDYLSSNSSPARIDVSEKTAGENWLPYVGGAAIIVAIVVAIVVAKMRKG